MQLRRRVTMVPSMTALAALLGMSVLAADGCGGSSKPSDDQPAKVKTTAAACRSDKTCTAAQNVCNADFGVCVACKTDGECGDNQLCIDAECVDVSSCDSSLDCSNAKRPICGQAGYCVQCKEHGDCASGERCENNRCRAGCTIDDDCSSQYTYCEQGACMPCFCDGESSKCLDNKTLATCAWNGSRYTFRECATSCVTVSKGSRTEKALAACEGEETKPDAGGGAGGASPGAGGSKGKGGSTSAGGSQGAGGSGEAGGSSAGAGGSSAPVEAGAGGSSTPVQDAAPEAAPTCSATDVLPGGEPCTSIPALKGSQVVDGLPDEFCNIPAKTFSTQNAAFVKPTGATDSTSQATVRAAWSPSALHVFVHVASAKVFQSTGDNLYDGDNVQFFVAGTKPTNATVDGTANGAANQLFVAPPASASGTVKSKVAQGTAKIEAAARLSSGGYDVEIKWPWPSTMSAGKQIGFDLMIGVSDPSAGGRKLEYLLYRGSPSGSCSEAYCDATLWCTPTLQ